MTGAISLFWWEAPDFTFRRCFGALILEYLDGECSLEDAVYTLKRDTRHFAKRQLTWFRRESEVTWIDKGRFDYNEEKILEDMIRELGEKEIYEKQ